MTVEDAFEARLRTAFAAAEPKDEDDSFAKQVLGRLDQAGRRRMLTLGGAGAAGSALASTQLEALFHHVEGGEAASKWLASFALGGVLSPEVLAAATIALGVSALAVFLPNRS